MFNSNRRHTEALEKAAQAKKRLADSEELIARNLKDLLSEDDSEESLTPPIIPKQPAATKDQTHKKR